MRENENKKHMVSVDHLLEMALALFNVKTITDVVGKEIRCNADCTNEQPPRTCRQ